MDLYIVDDCQSCAMSSRESDQDAIDERYAKDNERPNVVNPTARPGSPLWT